MELEVIMKPPGDTLDEYHRDDNRCVFIMGPLGSAKTFQTCQKVLNKMIGQEANAEGVRPTRFIAIRNTYPDLQTTTINDWLELWGDLGDFTNGNPPEHKIEFDLEDGTTVKSQMIFLALDRAEAIKKLRGTQTTGFWLNETKELSKAVLDMADLRHGRYPSLAAGGVKPTWHGMVGDTNAPDEDHWYYKLAEETTTPGWSFYKQPGGLIKDGEQFRENPKAENLRNLPEGYYVNGQVGKSKEWILVNLCNQYGFVSDGKPIYPEYEDSVHCMKEHPDLIKNGRDGSYRITVGIDFGLTPAAVFAQQTPSGQWQMLTEVVTEDMGAVRFGELLAQHMRAEYPGAIFDVWADPAGEQRSQADEKTPFQMMRKAGVPAKPTHTNDPTLRRESVVGPMTRLLLGGQPGWMISPRCKMLRKAMAGGYKYRRLQVAGEERYMDVPDKNRYSHVADAGQYLMVGGGEARILIKPALDTRNLKAKRAMRPRRRINA